MSTIKSSAENLTLNADGANNDVIIQSNGSTKVTVDGQNSRVGIGTASPILPLSIKASQEQLTISEGDARGGTFDYRSSTGNLQIATNGANARSAPQLTLNLNGDITANTGDIVFGTANKGIVLGATTNVAANTLDDYEEGTWTPALVGVTGSFTTSGTFNYTKVGRIVTLNGYIYSCSSISNTSAAWQFSGLPFAPIQDAQAAVALYNVDFNASNSYVTIRANANNSRLVLIENRDAAASIQLSFSQVGSGHVEFTITYATNN